MAKNIDKFCIESTFAFESIMDFPVSEGLISDIWKQNGEGQWELLPEVEGKLSDIASELISTFKIPQPSVHIIGSICSNLYAADTDIDLHFLSPRIRPEKVDDMIRLLRTKFEQMKALRPEIGLIGDHPIEVYFQVNEFQDYMSVGCYDLMTRAWMSGPEIYPMDYNPYAEYYDQIQMVLKDRMGNLRNIVLQGYELAMMLFNMRRFNLGEHGDAFYKKIESEFQILCEKAGIFYQELRRVRKTTSEPTSYQEAMKMRASREWHISDATFKMLNKWNYLKVLRYYADQSIPLDEKISNVVQLISENFGEVK